MLHWINFGENKQQTVTNNLIIGGNSYPKVMNLQQNKDNTFHSNIGSNSKAFARGNKGANCYMSYIEVLKT